MNRRQMQFLISCTAVFGVLRANPAVWAQPKPEQTMVHVTNAEELQRAVQNAKPGTTIRIASGMYRGGLQFRDLHGAADKPIILDAADKSNPPIFKGGGSGLHLSDPAFVELHNLIFDDAQGNGLNIDDGGSYDTPAHHLVLRGLTIRGSGVAGNRDGLKMSGVDNVRVESCTIERWGTSGSAIDMVGCHDGVISDCTFRHQGDIPANGVQTKGGSSQIVIQRCRFENAGGRGVNLGGSTGLPYFRPKSAKYEAKNITVEDCTFVGSMAPICFVGIDGATVRYNTIYRPSRYVIQILQENRSSEFNASRNGTFTNNLIVFRSDELRGAVNIGPGTQPESFGFSKNHWYCMDRPQNSNRVSLPVKELDGVYGIDPQFMDAEKSDLRLRETSQVRDAGVRAR
jgi:hypothetical protein